MNEVKLVSKPEERAVSALPDVLYIGRYAGSDSFFITSGDDQAASWLADHRGARRLWRVTEALIQEMSISPLVIARLVLKED
jgi:hypothetical protein